MTTRREKREPSALVHNQQSRTALSLLPRNQGHCPRWVHARDTNWVGQSHEHGQALLTLVSCNQLHREQTVRILGCLPAAGTGVCLSTKSKDTAIEHTHVRHGAGNLSAGLQIL